MIGIDTNVLVRVCLDDNPEEAEIAKQLLKGLSTQKKLFISSYAILELVWVLKGKGKSRQQVVELLLTLLDSPGIVVGQREVLLTALEYYQRGKADFGDYMILAEGEANHTHYLATFDKALYKENSHCHHPSNWLKIA